MQCSAVRSARPADLYLAEYEKPVSGLEGEGTTMAYVKLEKHNERLKEALIRCVDEPPSIAGSCNADIVAYGTCRPRRRRVIRPRSPSSSETSQLPMLFKVS